MGLPVEAFTVAGFGLNVTLAIGSFLYARRSHGALALELKVLGARCEAASQAAAESAGQNANLLARCETLEQQRRARGQGGSRFFADCKSDVLRLHEQGSPVPEIASALRLGQGEVKLMIKMQELFGEEAPHGAPKPPVRARHNTR